MASGNFYQDNEDLQFQLDKKIDYEVLFDLLSDEQKEAVGAESAEEYKKSWLEVLDTFGQICGESIAPNAKKVEEQKLTLTKGDVSFPDELLKNLEILKEFGSPGFSVSPRWGGMGAPVLFDMVGCEVLNRACPSTLLNASWYGAVAMILEKFASDDMRDKYIPELAQGKFSGNMALTEADAGSDLAALRTWADKQEDGSWKIYGQKRFISNGNGELSLVLAKNKKGVMGLHHLSLFLCPRHLEDGSDNISISKIEEKIALHASATCELNFDGSKAWLIGEEGQGYRYMLELMNDSRLGVGFQGVGLMEATFRIASEYAQERKTWGKPIARHELIAEKLLDMESELKATRSLAYKAAMSRTVQTLGTHYLKENQPDELRKKQVEQTVKKHSDKIREMTPLLKYWVGEQSVVHARAAMQVLGGYGFSTEYPAEKWVRESLIYSIYEGTSQIQALMCVKDTFKKLMKEPFRFIESYLKLQYKKINEKDPLKKKMLGIESMIQGSVLKMLIRLVKTNLKTSVSDQNKAELFKMARIIVREFKKFDNFRPAMLHAERLCQMKCYAALSQAIFEDAAIDPGRKKYAERFIHQAYAKVHSLHQQIVDEDLVIHQTLDFYESMDSEANVAEGK